MVQKRTFALLIFLSHFGAGVILGQIAEESPTIHPVARHNESTRLWILKFNPCLMARGELPLYLERRLTPGLSAEVGIGTTFEDYYKKVFLQGKTLTQKDPATEYLSGVALKSSIRYFVKKGALNDFYISPEVDYTTYRKNVAGDFRTGSGYTEGKLLDKQEYVDYLILIGSQNSREHDEEIFMDWFLGVGIRSGQENNVFRTENNSQMLVERKSKVLSPMITFGVKIGLGF